LEQFNPEEALKSIREKLANMEEEDSEEKPVNRNNK
jgi:hypothetical protein